MTLKADSQLLNLVTVVIPVYNRMAPLSAAISSAFAQKDVLVEVIVVDDGSSAPVGPKLAQDFPAARVIRLPQRRGAAVARNVGIDAAHGTQIAFLDSDDRFDSDKLIRQQRALEKTGALWSTCAYRTPNGRVWMGSQPRSRLLWRRNCLGGTSGLMADTRLLRALRFDPQMLAVQDWELFLRLQTAAPGCHLTQPLYTYETAGVDRISRQARRRQLGHVQLYRRHVLNNPSRSWGDHLAHRLIQSKLDADVRGHRSCALALRVAAKIGVAALAFGG